MEKKKLNKADQARRNRTAGKGFQTKCAKMHGGKNIGGLGGEDIEHLKFSIEAKYLVRFAGKKVMDQAIANNKNKKKITIAHVHLLNTKYEDDIIMLRLEDWMKIINSDSFDKWKEDEKQKRKDKKNGRTLL